MSFLLLERTKNTRWGVKLFPVRYLTAVLPLKVCSSVGASHWTSHNLLIPLVCDGISKPACRGDGAYLGVCGCLLAYSLILSHSCSCSSAWISVCFTRREKNKCFFPPQLSLRAGRSSDGNDFDLQLELKCGGKGKFRDYFLMFEAMDVFTRPRWWWEIRGERRR